jgi:hypothetical protein
MTDLEETLAITELHQLREAADKIPVPTTRTVMIAVIDLLIRDHERALGKG